MEGKSTICDDALHTIMFFACRKSLYVHKVRYRTSTINYTVRNVTNVAQQFVHAYVSIT